MIEGKCDIKSNKINLKLAGTRNELTTELIMILTKTVVEIAKASGLTNYDVFKVVTETSKETLDKFYNNKESEAVNMVMDILKNKGK